MVRFRVDAHIPPAFIDNIADTHTGLAALRRTLRTEHGMSAADSDAFIRNLLRAVLDDTGEHYSSLISGRIDNIVELRGRIDEVYSRAIEHGELPEGISVDDVRRWFRELDDEMDAVQEPQRWIVEDGPVVRDDLVSDLLTDAEQPRRRADGEARPDVEHAPAPDPRPVASDVPPHLRDAFHAVFSDLDEDTRRDVESLIELDPDAVRRILAGEEEGVVQRARRELAELARHNGMSGDRILRANQALATIGAKHGSARRAAAVDVHEGRLAELTGEAQATQSPTRAVDVIEEVFELDPADPVVAEFAQIPQSARERLASVAQTMPQHLRRALDAEDPEVRRAALDAIAEQQRRNGASDADIAETRLALERMRAVQEDASLRPAPEPPDSRFVEETTRARRTFAVLSENPHLLRELYRKWLNAGANRTFRGYVLLIMRTHYRGMAGEFGAAFALGDGFYILKGPDHDVTIPGTDLVAIHKETGEVWLIDNKALSQEQLSSVTALTDNLPQNLADDVDTFRAEIGGEAGLPAKIPDALDRLTRARSRIRDLTQGKSAAETRKLMPEIAEILREEGIQLVVTNAGGNVMGLSKRLRELGFLLEDVTD